MTTGLDDAAYWAHADRLQLALDAKWRNGAYQPAMSMLNANMLLTHAAAALVGHTGPARQDERARALVEHLCNGPSWARQPASGKQGHVPGWRGELAGGGIQHLVVDTEIAWALSYAWRARDVLGVDGDLIANRIISTATGDFWRWPALRLNQINWYARMYVAAGVVGGDREDLHDQLLKQLRRFVDGAKKPMSGAKIANLGPSYRFHYLPGWPEHHKYNLDSAEYANIVCGVLVPYAVAREAGMQPLDSTRSAVIRNWSERVMCGYWTHAGYLNWDTGLGFKRWHQGKKLGLSQAALLGMAVAPELARNGNWAKHMLDRSFELFDRWTERAGGVPPANAFGVPSIDGNESSAVLAAARVQSNVAQAALLGLGSKPSEEPPPLYAYDPDVGRLAVTTPHYNTAVVGVNRQAFPYGGIELARLFDGRQEVAGGVGGRPPAAFGVVVREASGTIIAASQRSYQDDSPLDLLAPKLTNPPHAGPFTSLRVRGKVERNGITITTTHRFAASYIETAWDVDGASGKRVEVVFPSWGSKATVSAVDRSGARRAVTGTLSLDDIEWFHIESEHSGYVVVIRSGATKATASTRAVAAQSSAPNPGPTLAVRASGSSIVARVAPAPTAAQAESIAARLV
ncbi:hypothetical protein OJ962_09475 [Solirubrobacter sp. CPCC 204708]|uniref:Uncharacterized protein n=1 Tax=Solirubrobacter deserti TaxID=2282478 RepID=A0ABT4RGQ6_9ACTN|nr:hypothetical protein [Solirubrobacter deserti]